MKKLTLLIILAMVFSLVWAAQYDYNPSDSPAQDDYYSNTYDENDWTDIIVSHTDQLTDVVIDYTWDTDYFASEGSFHIESPSGTLVEIASGDSDGTYSVTLTDFAGETMNGTWKLWIEDSFGDGGHQATNITVSFHYEVAGAPGAASNPSPAHQDIDVPVTGNLTWDFGADTDSYDLWFGPTGAMTDVVRDATVFL